MFCTLLFKQYSRFLLKFLLKLYQIKKEISSKKKEEISRRILYIIYN